MFRQAGFWGCGVAAVSAIVAGMILSASVSAKADGGRVSDPAAIQVAGMFMQTCVRYAGSQESLRLLMAEKKAPSLDQAGARPFLVDGRRGIVYDTSNGIVGMGLVSRDDGTCDAFAADVDGELAVGAVEDFLKASRIDYRLTDDRSDPRAPELRHRHYDLDAGDRKWSLVLSTSPAEDRWHVMFSALPR